MILGPDGQPAFNELAPLSTHSLTVADRGLVQFTDAKSGTTLVVPVGTVFQIVSQYLEAIAKGFLVLGVAPQNGRTLHTPASPNGSQPGS